MDSNMEWIEAAIKLGSKKRREEFLKQEQLQSGHISNKKMNVIYYHSRQYQ